MILVIFYINDEDELNVTCNTGYTDKHRNFAN